MRLGLLTLVLAACSHGAPARTDGATRAGDLATAARDLARAGDAAGGATGDGATPSCAVAASGRWLDLVDAIVAQMRAKAGAGSQALTAPAPADRDAFARAVVAILDGDESAACALPSSYRLVRLADPAGALRVIAEVDAQATPAPSLFWGTYAAPLAPPAHPRALAVEAPHPLFDTGTEHQAADIFQQVGARYSLLAGAHRCADTQTSGCFGTTTACDASAAPYRVSDAAHATQLPFFAVHAQLSQRDAALVFLQLHGNAQACPSALVSDGSGSWSDADAAGKLGAALIARGVSVGKCGSGYPTSGCNLCGTDNVEGRFTAGAADACTMTGSDYARFVHVEQQLALRQSYQPLTDAVASTF